MLQCEMWVRDNKLRTCTVWINGKSRLSCSILAAGIEGQEVTTLEGLKEEAEEFGGISLHRKVQNSVDSALRDLL